MTYYTLTAMKTYFIHSPDPWLRSLPPGRVCPDCKEFHGNLETFNLVANSTPLQDPINIARDIHLGCASTEFLDVIGWNVVKEYLQLGTVCDQWGIRLEHLMTYQGTKKIWVRGGPLSVRHYRHCTNCGQPIYVPVNDWHLPQSTDLGLPIYESQMHTLIVSEPIAKRIKEREFKNLSCIELPIIDKPLDGLPLDLS